MQELMDAIVAMNWAKIMVLVPELKELEGVQQPEDFHVGDVLEHTKLVVKAAIEAEASGLVVLAALLHDIGKPAVAAFNEEKQRWTFYKHPAKSVEKAGPILQRFTQDPEQTDIVLALVGAHELQYDPSWTDKAVRRMKLLPCGFRLLAQLRRADLAGQRQGDRIAIELEKLDALAARVAALPTV